jgi:hypothetical protein
MLPKNTDMHVAVSLKDPGAKVQFLDVQDPFAGL